jgi:hypothetical protein
MKRPSIASVYRTVKYDEWIAMVVNLPSGVGTEAQRVRRQSRIARRLVQQRADVREILADATADDHTVLVWFRRAA